ncbi:MAG: RNA-binding S4 domain-containing protein [Planctomycetes bacterium]|nr:RNA-binding S4 domain-containing protein [Planctomycetota bacterium]
MRQFLARPKIQRSDSLVSNEYLPDHQSLRLDQLLKLCGVAGTGGQAKLLIQGGEVLVNGELETRRSRKLVLGDVVQFDGKDYPVSEFVSDQ